MASPSARALPVEPGVFSRQASGLVRVVQFAWAAALGATLLATFGVSPLLATVGAVAGNRTLLDAAAATASPNGIFVIGVLTLVLAGVLMTTGTRRYFVAQKALFAIAMVGVLVLAVLLAFGSRATFAAHLSSIGGLEYDKVISTAEAHGYADRGFSLGASLLFVVFGYFALSAAPLSMSLSGEIRRVRRSQLFGMFGALLCTALVIAMFDPLARHAFGQRFLGAIAYNSINGVTDGSTEGTIGVPPYLPVLAGILGGNVVLTIIICATFAVWVWFWVPGLCAYATRSMIAWSFDRVAPDRLGYVSQRFHTPVVAIWTFIGGGAALTWLIAYRHLAFLTFIEVQVAIWVAAHIAAMIFPYRRPAIYRDSPVARLRVFGVPLMSVTGFLGALFLSLVLYLMWNDPVAAGPLIRNPLPVEFWITVATIGFGILWYLGVKRYRRRQGIDIRLAFQQIPIE